MFIIVRANGYHLKYFMFLSFYDRLACVTLRSHIAG
nr:MAG TPA: hypothetical protein [Caudoviricetes sp.]